MELHSTSQLMKINRNKQKQISAFNGNYIEYESKGD